MRDKGRRQALPVESLLSYLRHSDAVEVAKRDVAGWLDHAVTTHRPSTVSKVYLPTIKSLFRWADEKHLIPADATGLRVVTPKKVQNR